MEDPTAVAGAQTTEPATDAVPASAPDGSGQKPVGGKTPENVPYTQYVGVKEMLQRSEGVAKESQSHVNTLTKQVSDLNSRIEQLQTSQVDPAKLEATQVRADKAETALHEAKVEHIQTVFDIKDEQTVTEMKAMTTEQLKVFEIGLRVAGNVNAPKPDLSGGGGGSQPDRAMDKIKSGFDALHPVT